MNPNKLTPGHNLMWESSRMMLPEHKMRIREHQKELTIRRKPIFDEQQIELFSQAITDAIGENRELKIQIFHPYRDHFIKGKVQKLHPEQRQLKIVSESNAEWVKFEEIIDVQVM